MQKSAFFIVAFFLLSFVSAQLFVNEVMSSNTKIPDDDGNFSDWFELYNNDSNAVNLDGYYATDTVSLPTQWRFPNISIEANGFLLVWASGKNRTTNNILHTNFAIKAGGEPVRLIYTDGSTLVNEIPATSIPSDTTYGRITDGGNLSFLSYVTPGTSNNIAPSVPLSINFSKSAGFYSDNFNLTINSSHINATIYYTLDGSIPTINSSTYSSPILITNNSDKANNISTINSTSPYYMSPKGNVQKITIVRAIAVDGNESTSVKTSSYLVNKSFTLPVISLSTDYSTLFDYDTGIYTKGKAWDDAEASNWQGTLDFHPANYEYDTDAWERLSHVEFFESNGSRVLDQNVGMKISGQGSRSRAQKSIRLYARSEYAASSMPYQIFPDQNLSSYKRLTLRNADDDNQTTFIRDVLSSKLINDTSLATEDYRPVILFLNGEYWGLYPLREKANQHYLESHYGVNKDNVIILEDNALVNQGVEGDQQSYLDLVDFVRTHDMADSTNYDYVKSLMDTESFARYYTLETFVGNTDWPSRNVEFWRLKTNSTNTSAPYGWDGRWRWVLHDTDYGFGYKNWQGSNYDMFNHIDQSTWGGVLWRGLTDNEQFRDQFVTITEDQLNTNFASSRIVSILSDLASTLAPEVQQQIDRWTTLQNVSQWEQNIEYMKQYAKDRPDYYRTHLINHFGLGGLVNLTVNGNDSLGTVSVNTLNLSTPFTYTYFQDIPLKITATPLSGKVFIGWSGAASGTNKTITIVLSNDSVINAVFADSSNASISSNASSFWVSRKYPSTKQNLIEGQNLNLSISLVNSTPVNITWVVDGNTTSNTSQEFNYHASTNSLGNHSVDVILSDSNTTLVQHWALSVKKPVGKTCYSNLTTAPATCTGGVIVQDISGIGSCRTVICNSSATNSSLEVLACDKPNGNDPFWFEMYRQNVTGSGLKICLGTGCIGDNGFDQVNYPTCIIDRAINFSSVYPTSNITMTLGENSIMNYSIINNLELPITSHWYIDGTLINEQEGLESYDFSPLNTGNYTILVNVSSNESTISNSWLVNVINSTSNSTDNNSTENSSGTSGSSSGGGSGGGSSSSSCSVKVNEMPVSCDGGSITTDTLGSCRTIICSNNSNSLQILACDKPASSSAQYFEMYKQFQVGTAKEKICLGNTCIKDNGFAKSPNFPICPEGVNATTTNTSQGSNNTNTTTNTTNTNTTAQANLVIAPWFPKGKNYVFVCNATGFTPTSYEFFFGDNQKLVNYFSNNVYHTYSSSGNYNVSCITKGSNVIESKLTINVTS